MATVDSLSPVAAPDRVELAARYADLYAVLRQHAAASDREGVLAPAALAAVRASGILAAAVPVEFGGDGGTPC